MQAFTFIAITHNQQYQGLSDCHWTLQPTNQVISHLQHLSPIVFMVTSTGCYPDLSLLLTGPTW